MYKKKWPFGSGSWNSGLMAQNIITKNVLDKNRRKVKRPNYWRSDYWGSTVKIQCTSRLITYMCIFLSHQMQIKVIEEVVYIYRKCICRQMHNPFTMYRREYDSVWDILTVWDTIRSAFWEQRWFTSLVSFKTSCHLYYKQDGVQGWYSVSLSVVAVQKYMYTYFVTYACGSFGNYGLIIKAQTLWTLLVLRWAIQHVQCMTICKLW